MIFFETLFQGQNLYIMIALGIFTFGVIYLMAKRMASRMSSEEKIFYMQLSRQRRNLAFVQLAGFGVLILLMFILWAAGRR